MKGNHSTFRVHTLQTLLVNTSRSKHKGQFYVLLGSLQRQQLLLLFPISTNYLILRAFKRSLKYRECHHEIHFSLYFFSLLLFQSITILHWKENLKGNGWLKGFTSEGKFPFVGTSLIVRGRSPPEFGHLPRFISVVIKVFDVYCGWLGGGFGVNSGPQPPQAIFL